MSRDSRNDTGAVRSDALIGDDAVETLGRDERIEASEVSVEVKDAEVTLSGDVPEPQMRALAEEIVAGLPGVRSVRNLIRYDDGADSFGPPGEAVRGLDPDENPGPTEAPRSTGGGSRT